MRTRSQVKAIAEVPQKVKSLKAEGKKSEYEYHELDDIIV